MSKEPKTEEKIYILKAFNANTQKVEDHEVTIDRNGEYVLTAEDGSFIKLPKDFTKDQILAYLEKHEADNKGKVFQDMEDVEKENKAKLDALMQ